MTAKCFVCGATDKERVCLQCVTEGVEKFVCVRCLPMLIHGGQWLQSSGAAAKAFRAAMTSRSGAPPS